jgi:hypothetical protein
MLLALIEVVSGLMLPRIYARRSRTPLAIAEWRPQFLSPTWLNNFPFPSAVPLTLLSSLSGWPEQAGADFLTLGLSFLSACQQLASSFSHFASALPRRAMIRR